MAKFSTFLYGTGILYGHLMALTDVFPPSGPSIGGYPFTLVGDSFVYNNFNDDFTGGVLDAVKWADISAGGGSISTGSSHLTLTTGVGVGAIAGIESVPSYADTQWEAKINIPPISVYPATAVSLFIASSGESKCDTIAL